MKSGEVMKSSEVWRGLAKSGEVWRGLRKSGEVMNLRKSGEI